MAGRGPAPKDAAQRRRSNAPARGEWVDLAPLAEPVLAELPQLLRYDADSGEWVDAEWRPDSREMWTAWRADAVTAQWSPADLAYALDTIRLYDAGGPPNELRLRMDSLGLTPKGKRDLRWRITEAAEPEVQREAQVRNLRAI